MVKAVYTGNDKNLQGEKALLRKDGISRFALQFDNTKLPEAYGWHKFDKKDFVIIHRYKRKQRNLLDIIKEVL